MFFPVDAPLEETCAELRALRRSLNSPVVTLESLPVGPASAAIALHPGPPDQPRVTIAIRSVEGRQVAFYGADPERAGFPSAGVAVDAALSFAESMGFLFDDDDVEALGDDGPQRAGGLWSEFVSPRPAGRPDGAPELLLEDLAESPQVASAARRLEAVPAPEIIEPEPLPAALLRPEPPPELELEPDLELEKEPEPDLELENEPEPAVARAPQIELEPDLEPEPEPEPGPDTEPEPEPDLADAVAPPLLMTKFRRAAASLAAEAAPDARLRLLSRF